MGLTKKHAKFIWDNDREQASLAPKKAQFIIQSYRILREMALIVLSTDANDIWMGAVLEQEQKVAGRMVKRVIPYV